MTTLTRMGLYLKPGKHTSADICYGAARNFQRITRPTSIICPHNIIGPAHLISASSIKGYNKGKLRQGKALWKVMTACQSFPWLCQFLNGCIDSKSDPWDAWCPCSSRWVCPSNTCGVWDLSSSSRPMQLRPAQSKLQLSSSQSDTRVPGQKEHLAVHDSWLVFCIEWKFSLFILLSFLAKVKLDFVMSSESKLVYDHCLCDPLYELANSWCSPQAPGSHRLHQSGFLLPL